MQFFGCFYNSPCKKAPLKWAKVCVLVHAYGQIFGFYWAHSHRLALHFLALGWWWWAHLLLHHHVIRHFGSIHTLRIPTSHHALCSLTITRAKGGVSSSVLTSRRGFVLTGVLSQLRSACFSWRHCCCSSWRWREEEEPEVRCWPELFECGALGRGHWTTVAHQRGPPCDKPGNVEWRPVKRKKLSHYVWNTFSFYDYLLYQYNIFPATLYNKLWSTLAPCI